MRRVMLKPEEVARVIALVEEGGQFEVLDRLVYGREAAAFVLRGNTWFTLGHFDRAAFVAVSQLENGKAELRITHINVPRAWHGVNIFRGADRGIEDQIHDYIVRNLEPM